MSLVLMVHPGFEGFSGGFLVEGDRSLAWFAARSQYGSNPSGVVKIRTSWPSDECMKVMVMPMAGQVR
jgi:hypothetical protein